MTLIERTIKTQKAELKKAHNERFIIGDFEFRLIYEGGLAEFFRIMCRKVGERNFKYLTGFNSYKLVSKEAVINHAKELVSQKVKD